MLKDFFKMDRVRKACLLIILACFCLFIGSSQASTTTTNETKTSQIQKTFAQDTVTPKENPPDKYTALEGQVNVLERRVESELRAADTRFQAMAQSTDKAFNVLIWLGAIIGAIGTISGVVIIVLTWIRDRQQHEDYQHERRFYEERVVPADAREEERIVHADAREDDRYARSMKMSEDMLERQINSMTKLGDVIKLVQEAFNLQLVSEKEQEKRQEHFRKMGEMFDNVNKHFQSRYKEVAQLILTFKNHSRMAWTYLTSTEENLAARARTTFATIPEFTFDQFEGAQQYKLGKVKQLLGVSAYYANDIDAAVGYLQSAKKLYDADTPVEYLYPRVFCLHFLGLIEKNWRHEDRSREANWGEAKQNLEDATVLLKGEESEYLTPLTLAEVLSCLESERDSAKELTEEKIGQLETRKESGVGLNKNQSELLVRAYLIRGNLDYIIGHLTGASEWYQRAINHSSDSHYAWLSKALSTPTENGEDRKKSFQKGLKRLKDSDALTKREDIVRMTAFAWGAIAAAEVGDLVVKKRFQKELDTAALIIRPVAHREPLFFSPMDKIPVSLNELIQSVKATIQNVNDSVRPTTG